MLYGGFLCVRYGKLLGTVLHVDGVWQSATPTDIPDKQNHQLNAEHITFKSHGETSFQSKSSKRASGAENTIGDAQRKKQSGFMSYGQESQ